MPYYLSQKTDREKRFQKQGWTEIARYLREIDPGHHPVTIHPSDYGHEQVEDASLIDFDMVQSGHSDRDSVSTHVTRVVESVNRRPRMPVVVGEVCYEGIMGASGENIQRFMFWSSILSGSCGHSYGGNGIWQVNIRQEPFGPSPHGRSWGDAAWEDVYRLPGSTQMGVARRILERYRWWELVPHPEWVKPSWSPTNYFGCYAAGIPGQLRIIFVPAGTTAGPTVRELEVGTIYQASYFDPNLYPQVRGGGLVRITHWCISIVKRAWKRTDISKISTNEDYEDTYYNILSFELQW